MSQDELEKIIKAAAAKKKKRKKQRPTVYSKAPKRDPKRAVRGDGEPTTDALERWKAAEFLREFTAWAKVWFPGYRPGVITHEVKAVKEFLNILEDSDACPRSQLAVIREAARRLTRYKTTWGLISTPGAWWLRTHATQILEDLKHLIYGVASLRYLMTEDVPVDDILTVKKHDECWIISWQDMSVQVHESHLDRINNPYLLRLLGHTEQERTPDNENTRGWEG